MNGCRIYQPFPCVYHIETPGNVFCTLIDGEDRSLLIDTGFGCCDLKEQVRLIAGGKEVVLLHTHGHFDHIMGDFRFDKAYLRSEDFFLIKFAMSEENKKRISDMTWFNMEKYDLEKFFSYDGKNIFPMLCNHIEIGNLDISIFPIRNHSKGGVCFYIEKLKLLIAGDSITPFLSLVFPGSSSLSENIDILIDAGKLDFSYILSSHSSILYGRDLLDRLIICSHKCMTDKGIRYSELIWPEFSGRLVAYQDGNPDDAVYVCFDEKRR